MVGNNMKKILLLAILALFLSSCERRGQPYYQTEQRGLGGVLRSISQDLGEQIRRDEQRRANTVKCYPDVYGQISTTYTCR
jgi:hypothetical protein